MNNKLSKEDLEAKALNLNIHNHCMFLFASMLKRCAMGNYYRQVSPFTFEESSGNAIAFCDGGYKDDYGNLLVIEVKTRIIKESQVNPADAIKKAISQELKDELFNYDFIVPVFMYTANHRAAWSFDDAKVMIYFGTANNRKWTNPRTLHEHYNDVMMSSSISELFDNLNTIQSRCVQLELMQATPPLETIEPLPTLSKQTTPACPYVPRKLKNRYFFMRYDQKTLSGWAQLKEIMLESGFYSNSRNVASNILRSLGQAVGTGAMSLVIEWRGNMYDLDKSTLKKKMDNEIIRYSFRLSILEMLKDSDLLIMFINEKYVYEEENFKTFNEYMDSLKLDEVGA